MELDGENLNQELEFFYSHLKTVYDINLGEQIKNLGNRNSRSYEIDPNKRIEEVNRLKNNLKSKENIIYDINYTFVDQNKLDIILEKNDLQGKKVKLQHEIQLQKDMDKDKYEELTKQLSDLKKDEVCLEEQYLNDKNNFKKIDDVYVTFYNTEDCEIIRSSYNKSNLNRCCKILCCNRKKIQHL